MKVLYTKKQADEIIETLKRMEQMGSINEEYIKIVKELLKTGYKGAVIHFYNRLYKEVPRMAKYFSKKGG